MTYAEKLQDPRWQKKRLKTMERDDFKCRECKRSDKTLNVHHFHYEKNPWDCEDHFLITLCRDCHEERQGIDDAAKNALELVLSQSSLAQATALAEHLAATASDATRGMRFDMAETGWLDNDRWLSYAQQYPRHREFVEMVLGRPLTWRDS